MRLFRPLVVAIAMTGCAVDDGVSIELARQARAAEVGVSKISHGLSSLEPASRGLGEGVRDVERATRELAALETDERASDAQRLQAIVLQARAWDDAARAIDTGMTADVGAAQPALIDALRDKSYPAQIAARNSYGRALRVACSGALEDPAVLLEIIDGLARSGGPSISPDHPCR